MRTQSLFASGGNAPPPPYGRSRSLSSGEKAYGTYQALQDEGERPHVPQGFSRRLQSSDEFSKMEQAAERGGVHPLAAAGASTAKPSIRSGRQRKKLAVRTKGGEFEARRRKRRVYFCSISNEIDVEKIYDDFSFATEDKAWKFTMYSNVLHLYLAMADPSLTGQPAFGEGHLQSSAVDSPDMNGYGDAADDLDVELGSKIEMQSGLRSLESHGLASSGISGGSKSRREAPMAGETELLTSQSKEVFIFDFGAIVFWGFSLGEEANLLTYVRSFTLSQSNKLSAEEFSAGEDDMAFITSDPRAPFGGDISIANDVFQLSDDTSVRQRLAISFAIAQSSVLAIFEARIEAKVEAFKYIPEAFARDGSVKLSSKKLGKMIGDVFVIRHDVNLHTEILDTPDWFWSQQDVEGIYKMTGEYLEMAGRTLILNKRLDMLKQLLSMLQQQNEAEHNVKLEVIIIWLIVVSVLLEMLSVGGKVIGWWA